MVREKLFYNELETPVCEPIYIKTDAYFEKVDRVQLINEEATRFAVHRGRNGVKWKVT